MVLLGGRGPGRRLAAVTAVIEGIDLWRAARIMVKRYGDGAAIEAAMRADEFLDQGNLDGQRLWMRIMETIGELQRKRPRDGEAMH